MIGSQILTNLQQFKKAVDSGLHQFAVHTWSHTVQTSLSNEQVVADLGWTMRESLPNAFIFSHSI